MAARLTIERLGARGEGIARGPEGPIFVPYAVPGDVVVAEVDGDRGRLAELVTPSPDRVAPFCPYYGVCGGCAVQSLAPAPYAAWKRDIVETALAQAHLDLPVAPVVDAHGAGRRRATFHSRSDGSGVVVGFMRAREHAIVDIDACPILAPDMGGAVRAARVLARTLAATGKPLDIVISATEAGLDVDLRGTGPLDGAMRRAVIARAEALDCARVSNHGEVIVERRPPTLTMGASTLVLSPGGFLQATAAGEEALAGRVLAAVGNAKRVADLFSGVGTFALRLASQARVHAVEADPAALAALERAARTAPGLRAVTGERRDLMARPLTRDELGAYDAVVIDPPRTGAAAQVAQLAVSSIPVVVSVSCNAATFARDAAVLLAGGYVCDAVTPIDQFRWSPHIETIAIFKKPLRKSRSRGLLRG